MGYAGWARWGHPAARGLTPERSCLGQPVSLVRGRLPRGGRGGWESRPILELCSCGFWG